MEKNETFKAICLRMAEAEVRKDWIEVKLQLEALATFQTIHGVFVEIRSTSYTDASRERIHVAAV